MNQKGLPDCGKKKRFHRDLSKLVQCALDPIFKFKGSNMLPFQNNKGSQQSKRQELLQCSREIIILGNGKHFCSVSNILVQYSDIWGQAQSMCKRWDKRRNWQISIHDGIEEDNQCSRTFCALGMSKECIDRARWKKLMDFFFFTPIIVQYRSFKACSAAHFCSFTSIWSYRRIVLLLPEG